MKIVRQRSLCNMIAASMGSYCGNTELEQKKMLHKITDHV